MDVALDELNEAVKLDPNHAQRLQHLRPRLRDDGRQREGRAELPAGARARAAGFRDPSQLGLVPVHARAIRARRIPEFELAIQQPAVQDAGDRADQRRPVQHVASATSRTPKSISSARSRCRRTTRPPSYGLALLAYKRGKIRRCARLDPACWCMANPTAPSALSRHVHRAQARRPPGRAFVHFAVAQPLSRLGGNQGDPHGKLRMSRARRRANEQRPTTWRIESRRSCGGRG